MAPRPARQQQQRTSRSSSVMSPSSRQQNRGMVATEADLRPFRVESPGQLEDPEWGDTTYQLPHYRYPHTLSFLNRFPPDAEAAIIRDFEARRAAAGPTVLPPTASFQSFGSEDEASDAQESVEQSLGWGGYVRDLVSMGLDWAAERVRPTPTTRMPALQVQQHSRRVATSQRRSRIDADRLNSSPTHRVRPRSNLDQVATPLASSFDNQPDLKAESESDGEIWNEIEAGVNRLHPRGRLPTVLRPRHTGISRPNANRRQPAITRRPNPDQRWTRAQRTVPIAPLNRPARTAQMAQTAATAPTEEDSDNDTVVASDYEEVAQRYLHHHPHTVTQYWALRGPSERGQGASNELHGQNVQSSYLPTNSAFYLPSEDAFRAPELRYPQPGPVQSATILEHDTRAPASALPTHLRRHGEDRRRRNSTEVNPLRAHAARVSKSTARSTRDRSGMHALLRHRIASGSFGTFDEGLPDSERPYRLLPRGSGNKKDQPDPDEGKKKR